MARSDARVGSMQVGIAVLGQFSGAPGTAIVGASLQVGKSVLGQTEIPHFGSVGAAAGIAASGRVIRLGQGAVSAVATIAEQGHRQWIPYRPDLLKLFKPRGGSRVGVGLCVGVSKLGETFQDLVEVHDVSAIELTDGYDVGGDNNVLSIDPLTGTATISHRVHPKPGDRVQDFAAVRDMSAGDSWELRYGDAIVAQGVVLHVETRVSSDGAYWVKQTRYALGGSASRMLAASASWTGLPEEGALTRLKRFFGVDTSLLTGEQRAYLDTVLAPVEDEPGEATRLDLARAFTDQTAFPVRTKNNLAGESSAADLIVVPAVVFRGTDPTPLYLPPVTSWTRDAEFLSEQSRSEKVQTVEVIKNFDMFISGVGKQAMTGGRLGMSFVLGSSRVGAGGALSVDVGVRAPVVVSLFGNTKVISQINHVFSSTGYRSSLDLANPAVIT